MGPILARAVNTLLTFPDPLGMSLSIRAKALLFHDPRSSELLPQVERIARSDATALVIGATGTGKELIARHIHQQSGRRGPFIAVNCGAFSESLIDAELFGHEAGAFTGAAQARAGWFESANGGTLFLDEIGDLSMGLQVKLLRVLQERQVVRLGSRRPVALDVRLIAATNVDLHQAIAAGRFRADLYYRLGVATIDLPPLCERPGDIVPLARHFIGMYATRLKLDTIELSEEAQSVLLGYEWPGNIRELENVIHYALIVCRGNTIAADDLKLSGIHLRRPAAVLPARLPDPLPERRVMALQRSGPTTDPGEGRTGAGTAGLAGRLESLFGEFLDAGQPGLFDLVEQALIGSVFARFRQNQVQTARALGISRNILRAHLKRYGLIGPLQPGASGEEGEPGAIAAAN